MKVTQPKKDLKPGEQQIESSHCCGRCLYNVPQGSFMLIVPGIMTLAIGIILFATNTGDSWRDGMIKADIIFIVLGGALLGVGMVFCLSQWCRTRPVKQPSYPDAAPLDVSTGDSTVQLVGVYRINVNETFT